MKLKLDLNSFQFEFDLKLTATWIWLRFFDFSLLIAAVNLLSNPAYRNKICGKIQEMQCHNVIGFITNKTY